MTDETDPPQFFTYRDYQDARVFAIALLEDPRTLELIAVTISEKITASELGDQLAILADRIQQEQSARLLDLKLQRPVEASLQ